MTGWWILWTVVAVGGLTWQVRRALRETSERDAISADAKRHTAPLLGTGPGADERPGSDAVVQDELELLWDLPAYDPAAAAIDEGLTRLFEELGPPPVPDPQLDAGCDRLWDAIHEHRKEESD
jgi:hypothetical protein